MAIDKITNKWDTFKRIVGKEPFGGRYPGDVPEFDIPSNKIDEVYLTVKKMQKGYHGRRDPTAKYFAKSFRLIEDAYLSRDMNAFKEAVRELMENIDSD